MGRMPRRGSRGITVRGRAFRWTVKGGKGRLCGTSSCSLRLSIQEDSPTPGRVARFFLTSVEWTPDHENSPDIYATSHRVSLFPREVKKLIESAMDRGWDPSEPGGPVSFSGFSGLRDYIVETVCGECGIPFRHLPGCKMLEVQKVMLS